MRCYNYKLAQFFNKFMAGGLLHASTKLSLNSNEER